MISPVTVTTLPGTGLPSTEAPTVVADHGSPGFSPSVPMALSQPPSGVICGCNTPPDLVAVFLPSVFFSSAADRVKASAATARAAMNVFLDICSPLLMNFIRAGMFILHANGTMREPACATSGVGYRTFAMVYTVGGNAKGSGRGIMESEHATLRIHVPRLREKLRDAAPDE